MFETTKIDEKEAVYGPFKKPFLLLVSVRLNTNTCLFWGATVAQWIHSRLPSCRPGFESKAHHLHFYQFKFEFKL